MLTTQELLTRAKEAQGIPSNYRLARVLGVPENTVARWKTGKNRPEDSMAIILAEMAGIDPAEALASIAAERSTGTARAVWERIAEQAHRAAVALCVILSLGFWSGGPDGGAFAGVAAPSPAFSQGPTVYYVNLLMQLLSRFGRKYRQLLADAARVACGVNSVGGLADMRP
jgi:plasmid maintenance system antidote protein VapI